MTDTSVPPPEPGREAALAFVQRHLAHLVTGPVAGSGRYRGGQSQAEAALARFDVRGYAGRRGVVAPASARGASGLSPYIRHGLLTLARVWEHVADGPPRDVGAFRDELLWQEYARHWYARLGRATAHGLRARQVPDAGPVSWNREMACVGTSLDELHEDGWVVNQARLWLAGELAVRRRHRWQDGEEHFFGHLLDGSRAANRLGWQWVAGTGSSRPHRSGRAQVERAAPELCDGCRLAQACPLEAPSAGDGRAHQPVVEDPRLRADPEVDATAGPRQIERSAPADAVWITAESLALDEPALEGHPTRPAVFVFDEPLLAHLGLSAKRVVFLTETLAEIAACRPLEIHVGDPSAVLRGRAVAATFAPVPGYRRHAARIEPVVEHPWPWLRRPHAGSIRSFSAWRRQGDHAGG